MRKLRIETRYRIGIFMSKVMLWCYYQSGGHIYFLLLHYELIKQSEELRKLSYEVLQAEARNKALKRLLEDGGEKSTKSSVSSLWGTKSKL